jgi:glycosyltransferase involved in cell wall biosynthesis
MQVSVLIATKNDEATIRTSIASALRALPRQSEVLVWNDGSTDSTSAVVRNIRDSRVHLYESAESRGSGAARTSLLNIARGEFVAILDADDVALPWRFWRLPAFMKDTDIGFTSALRFGLKGEATRPTGIFPLTGEDVAVALTIHNPIVHSTVIARRSALLSLGGYKALRKGQDYELWMRAARSGLRFRQRLVPGAGYRQSTSQISRQPDYSTQTDANLDITAELRLLIGHLSPGAEPNIEESVWRTRRANWTNLHALTARLHPITRCYYRSLLEQFKR